MAEGGSQHPAIKASKSEQGPKQRQLGEQQPPPQCAGRIENAARSNQHSAIDEPQPDNRGDDGRSRSAEAGKSRVGDLDHRRVPRGPSQ